MFWLVGWLPGSVGGPIPCRGLVLMGNICFLLRQMEVWLWVIGDIVEEKEVASFQNGIGRSFAGSYGVDTYVLAMSVDLTTIISCKKEKMLFSMAWLMRQFCAIFAFRDATDLEKAEWVLPRQLGFWGLSTITLSCILRVWVALLRSFYTPSGLRRRGRNAFYIFLPLLFTKKF